MVRIAQIAFLYDGIHLREQLSSGPIWFACDGNPAENGLVAVRNEPGLIYTGFLYAPEARSRRPSAGRSR